MSSFSRNSLITSGILVATIAMLLQIDASSERATKDTVDLGVVPYEIGSWKGTDIPMSPDVYEILDTKDILFREYRDESDYPVVVAVVCSKSNRDSFHPPEICYIGAGFHLMEKKVETLFSNDESAMTVTRLNLKSDDNFWITAWYWFMVGDKSGASYYWQQLSLLRNIFSKKSFRGALVRVSVDGSDLKEGEKEKVSQFVSYLVPYLNKVH